MEKMLGKILRTHWELKRNIVRTHWEVEKNEKNSPPFPRSPLPPPPKPQNIKGKKKGTLSACLGLPIGCMKFLFPKDFITIFGMG